MSPWLPSTVISWPSAMEHVARLAAITAGIPNSRTIMLLWLRAPPASVTSPAAIVNVGVHSGVAVGATKISPARSRLNSAISRIMRAGPVTTPGLTGSPLNTFCSLAWLPTKNCFSLTFNFL